MLIEIVKNTRKQVPCIHLLHTHTHTHTETHTQRHTHTHPLTHKHTHTQANTHTPTHTQTHAHTQIHTHKHAHTYTHYSFIWNQCERDCSHSCQLSLTLRNKFHVNTIYLCGCHTTNLRLGISLSEKRCILWFLIRSIYASWTVSPAFITWSSSNTDIHHMK